MTLPQRYLVFVAAGLCVGIACSLIGSVAVTAFGAEPVIAWTLVGNINGAITALTVRQLLLRP